MGQDRLTLKFALVYMPEAAKSIRLNCAFPENQQDIDFHLFKVITLTTGKPLVSCRIKPDLTSHILPMHVTVLHSIKEIWWAITLGVRISFYRNGENCVFLSYKITIHLMYPYSVLMRERKAILMFVLITVLKWVMWAGSIGLP